MQTELTIPLNRETARKLAIAFPENILQITIDGSLNLRLISKRFQCTPQMPSQHSPDKEPLSIQIPRALMGRLKKAAKQMKMTVPGYIVATLSEQLNDITLSSKDYEAIAEATRQAEQTGRRCSTRFDDPA